MPFNAPAPPPPPRPQAKESGKYITIASLYPSQGGTSLGGNVLLDRVPFREQQTLRDLLYELLEESANTGRPLRLLVFENDTTKFRKQAPYTAKLTLATPRGQGNGWPPPEEPTPGSVSEPSGQDAPPHWYTGPEDTAEAEPEIPAPRPEPTPRRPRVAPRR